MNDLEKYIFDYYPKLLTIEEKMARLHLNNLKKLKNDNLKSSIGLGLSTNKRVLKLVEDGEEEFFRKTLERVFNENPEVIFLNLCPQCNALARTPQAKQCPKCYFSWHNS